MDDGYCQTHLTDPIATDSNPMLVTVALILLATDAILRTVVAEEAVAAAAAEVESSQFQATSTRFRTYIRNVYYSQSRDEINDADGGNIDSGEHAIALKLQQSILKRNDKRQGAPKPATIPAAAT